MTDTYQAAGEGFRLAVTQAAVEELWRYLTNGRTSCPSCGMYVDSHNPRRVGAIQNHAESCVELRSDITDTL